MEKWKQLDVAKLQQQNRRVPLSFKIDSEQKFDLYLEAQKLNTDISTYLRYLVDERQKIFSYSKLQLQIKILQQEISSYKFEAIEEIFQKFKGKELQYLESGVQKTKKIDKLPDIYFVIFKSFKINES